MKIDIEESFSGQTHVLHVQKGGGKKIRAKNKSATWQLEIRSGWHATVKTFLTRGHLAPACFTSYMGKIYKPFAVNGESKAFSFYFLQVDFAYSIDTSASIKDNAIPPPIVTQIPSIY